MKKVIIPLEKEIFFKIYHQPGAQKDDELQGVNVFFG